MANVKPLVDTREKLPWRDAYRLMRDLGAAAGVCALQRVSDFEDGCDYDAALRWGRIYIAITRIESGERLPGEVLH